MEQGLAASMAPQASQMPTVEEVMQLLMQGTPPEELEQSGIPQELIVQAIQMLEQQMAQQQPQQAPAPQQMGGGLAQSMMGQ